MANREPLYNCETCGAPIYEGDQFCGFFSEAPFCADHTAKRSDELALLREAVKGTYSPYENEDYDEGDLMARIAQLEVKIATAGDAPVHLVTA